MSQQPLLGRYEPAILTTRHDERRATAQRPDFFGACAEPLRIAARARRRIGVQRTQRAGRFLRVPIEAPGPSAPARCRRRETSRRRRECAAPSISSPTATSAAWPAAAAPRPRTARYHPLDIAIDGMVRRPKRSRIWRRRCGPDPRQRSNLLGIRKHAAVVAQHRHRAGVQIARAGIIAEPGPHPQDVVERGGPSASTSGHRVTNFRKYGPTILTPVCCSMISDSPTR